MFRLAWLTAAIILVIAPGGDDKARDEPAMFEGVWSFSEVLVNGAKQPSMPYPTNRMIVLKDGRYVVIQGARITYGLAKLNPSTTPKQIDVTITQGPAKGRTTTGIYDLSADKYRFCGSLRGTGRPGALASTKDGGTILHIMKRERQMAKDALVELYRRELAGTWQATSFEREGAKASDEELAGIQVVLDAQGGTKSLIGGKTFLAGPSTIDPTTDPMNLDVTYTEGVNKGRTSLGIFKMEDGVLTICRRPPDKPRPTEFSSKPDSAMILIRYRRERSAAPN